MHAIDLYFRIKQNPHETFIPRTIIFGGKAAPSYFMAKLIIKLINQVGEIVNHDKETKDLLKIVFLANYRVSLAEKIIPAADLSEQISLAGTEASGTGNMKFALNGALTIGTLDGANIEMLEEIGSDNFFIFGLKTAEVSLLKAKGYHPYDYYNSNPKIKQILDSISDGYFSQGDKDLFKPIVDNLLGSDYFCLLPDFDSYIACQQSISDLYHNQEEWTKKSILNVARIGKFSSDRTIRDYAGEIWRLH